MNELELNFDINLDDFNINIDLDFEDTLNSRIITPPACKGISFVKESCATKLSEKIGYMGKNKRTFAILNGSFVYFDFIFEFLIQQNSHIKTMTISTLSMSKENIKKMEELIENDCISELNLIISDYFYSHEKNNLVKYLYHCLDKNNIFQLAVCRTHCKTCIFELQDGRKFVFHGSANLRSSNNLEQIMIEESEYLYNFNLEYQKNIIEHYKTINKSLTGKNLWKQVLGN
jgi:hypothetical protein